MMLVNNNVESPFMPMFKCTKLKTRGISHIEQISVEWMNEAQAPGKAITSNKGSNLRNQPPPLDILSKVKVNKSIVLETWPDTASLIILKYVNKGENDKKITWGNKLYDGRLWKRHLIQSGNPDSNLISSHGKTVAMSLAGHESCPMLPPSPQSAILSH